MQPYGMSTSRTNRRPLVASRGGPNAPQRNYAMVTGPVDPSTSLIRYELPFSPADPKRSVKLRRRFGEPIEESVVDPNVRVVLDSFIPPRAWYDDDGVLWVQHASPKPASRTDTVETHEKLRRRLRETGAKRTGICPIRSLLLAECFLEVIRQVTVECWERGLVLLKIHAERVAAQTAHRELFESRVGYAFRLALKGEKDTSRVQQDLGKLKKRMEELAEEEKTLRQQCDEASARGEEEMLIVGKQHSDEVAAIKKEGILKRNQLEHMISMPSTP
ncbi:chrX additional, unordered contigs [Trypanosoma equiperdum]|uniref:Dynein arm light chain, axonemal, putative n=2 Tax=Trypanozoon TaxID=39700 RepID=Q4FKF9_TRYB2|nr:dynein arm light chain axonemal [Trypanosoma brucei brucei TREU927]EAN77543.1 dynein arm light chain, axonemal, putative [Trypanosoma brucei brucei TREU927]CAJ17028.1 dynein light chain, putative [Trypanosoma brucei brucei TREU927]SCU72157.1 chrX additional, unordered contigs [Trypanosoma equiperdum]